MIPFGCQRTKQNVYQNCWCTKIFASLKVPRNCDFETHRHLITPLASCHLPIGEASLCCFCRCRSSALLEQSVRYSWFAHACVMKPIGFKTPFCVLLRRPNRLFSQEEGEIVHSGKKKAHKHKFFCPVGLGTTPGLSRGFHRVCPWDKSGENLGQTRVFSLFYTVEARFHRVCPWDKPGLSLGQSRGRRAAQKVYVKKMYVPFSLAIYTKELSRGLRGTSSYGIGV